MTNAVEVNKTGISRRQRVTRCAVIVVREGLSKKVACKQTDMRSERVSCMAIRVRVFLLKLYHVQRSCGRSVLGVFMELLY